MDLIAYAVLGGFMGWIGRLWMRTGAYRVTMAALARDVGGDAPAITSGHDKPRVSTRCDW